MWGIARLRGRSLIDGNQWSPPSVIPTKIEEPLTAVLPLLISSMSYTNGGSGWPSAYQSTTRWALQHSSISFHVSFLLSHLHQIFSTHCHATHTLLLHSCFLPALHYHLLHCTVVYVYACCYIDHIGLRCVGYLLRKHVPVCVLCPSLDPFLLCGHACSAFVSITVNTSPEDVCCQLLSSWVDYRNLVHFHFKRFLAINFSGRRKVCLQTSWAWRMHVYCYRSVLCQCAYVYLCVEIGEGL